MVLKLIFEFKGSKMVLKLIFKFGVFLLSVFLNILKKALIIVIGDVNKCISLYSVL